MILIDKISQHRRDFKGKYECEGCGTIDIDDGPSSYDDAYFHTNVIPAKECSNCGESTVSMGKTPRPIQTKYPEGMQI